MGDFLLTVVSVVSVHLFVIVVVVIPVVVVVIGTLSVSLRPNAIESMRVNLKYSLGRQLVQKVL